MAFDDLEEEDHQLRMKKLDDYGKRLYAMLGIAWPWVIMGGIAYGGISCAQSCSDEKNAEKRAK